ncbi:DUF438 domain-containing protein [Trichloromonas sp.]|uniref:DUF438 domain-containing protein n=1 Tax=Trichloromonas sp. TaxID=3069249 RepID=UPI002A4A183E|nr:PAS domain-containing protein [Trichloromonas sp.]
MSEFINNRENRVKQLLAFSQGIMKGEDCKDLAERYREAIDTMTPHDMLTLEDQQLQMGITPKVIKKDIEKVISTFFNSLEKYPWEKPDPDSFLGHLMEENQELTRKLNVIKENFNKYSNLQSNDFHDIKKELLPKFRGLKEFESHYVKKENILFPYLEKKWGNYRPLTVMWSLHDDIRKTLKEIISTLERQDSNLEKFNETLNNFLFLNYGMIQKENLIIYPVASETISDDEWDAMYQQSFEYPFPFIKAPMKKNSAIPTQKNINQNGISGGFFSETGKMSYEQVLLAFNHLPVDITFVDENDKVVFFNRANERFFPRSPAIIGRDVKNCHPPESVHIVERIVSEFKNGNRNEADFRIKMRGKYILIRYFAVRDENKKYRGVIEVGQDITDIVQMKNEKRLLDWE